MYSIWGWLRSYKRAAEARERAATTGPKCAKSGPNLALHKFLQL